MKPIAGRRREQRTRKDPRYKKRKKKKKKRKREKKKKKKGGAGDKIFLLGRFACLPLINGNHGNVVCINRVEEQHQPAGQIAWSEVRPRALMLSNSERGRACMSKVHDQSTTMR